jgi:hypothetical protein
MAVTGAERHTLMRQGHEPRICPKYTTKWTEKQVFGRIFVNRDAKKTKSEEWIILVISKKI